MALLGPGNAVHLRGIRTDRDFGDRLEVSDGVSGGVSDGVSGGDEVALNPGDSISEGSPVYPVRAAPPQSPVSAKQAKGISSSHMERKQWQILAGSVLFLAGTFVAFGQGGAPAGTPGMTLTSPAFPDGGKIPSKYTQRVPNPVSPQLDWTHVPRGVASFVLILHDPDVAKQKTTEDQLHWLVLNIPGTARQLPEGASGSSPNLADGAIQLKNGGNTVGYRGPGAPASGPDHHYTFELYALDTKLDLGPNATRADVLKAIDGHILAKAVMVGRFHK